MNKFLISIIVGVIIFFCIAICLYKEKIVSYISNIRFPQLVKQILILFLSVFSIGTIAFVVSTKYFCLETLNSYFSLLSSLTTIFAAIVAVLVTQDFRKQKRAELLSEFSKEKSNTIIWMYKQLQPISEAIKLDCNTLNEENIENHNFQSLSKRLQKINKNKKFKDMCVNFTQRFEGICKLVDKNHQNLIQNTNRLLDDYLSLLINLNDSIKYYYYFLPEEKKKLFDYVKKNEKLYEEIDEHLLKILRLLKSHSLYL